MNNDAVTTSTKPLVYHSINEEPFSFDVTQDTEHILTSSINKIPNRDNSKTAYVDHNGKSKEEEDYHPSAWYRLGPITSNLSQSCTYVAQVSNDKREFHNIIGKEQIDNKMCYLVDWTPSLVPYEILKEAKAQSLIDLFETRCQSQKTALGFEHNPSSYREDCNENWLREQQHKEVAIGEIYEDEENEYTQNRWEQKRWQQTDISDIEHSDDSAPNSSDQGDEFRPAKRQKTSSMPTNYDLIPSNQHNMKHCLRKRHTLKMNMVQSQGCDRHLQTPIDNHHCYPSAFQAPSGINLKNSKSAEIPPLTNAIVHSKVQK